MTRRSGSPNFRIYEEKRKKRYIHTSASLILIEIILGIRLDDVLHIILDPSTDNIICFAEIRTLSTAYHDHTIRSA